MKRGYYRFAGGFSLVTLLLSWVAATAVTAALVSVYVRVRSDAAAPDPLRVYAPIVLPSLMALGVGAVVKLIVYARKLRSRAGTIVSIGGAALAAFAVGWYLRRAAHVDAIPVAAGWIIDGPALQLLWASEALLVGAVITGMIQATMATPLCPFCHHWCRIKRVGKLPFAKPREARARLEGRDWSFFRELAAGKRRRRRGWLEVQLAGCPSCGQTNALSVAAHRPWGRRRVVEHLLLSPASVRTIRALAGRGLLARHGHV